MKNQSYTKVLIAYSKTVLMGLCFAFLGYGVVSFVFAAAPNPGHTWSELGDVAATVTQGGTGLSSASQGDLIYGSATNTFSLLAKNASATRYISNTGTNNNPAWAQIDLSNGVTSTLPVANGGTGATSLTANNVILGNGTNAVQFVAPGTSGNVLTSNGTTWASSAPTGKLILAARTLSLINSAFCHPSDGSCVYSSPDQTLGLIIPFAITLKSLTAIMSSAPATNTTCTFTIHSSTNSCTSFTSTALTCAVVGNGSNYSCSITGQSISLIAGICLRMIFTDSSDCTGNDSWVIEANY